jgi:hypothetical protein
MDNKQGWVRKTWDALKKLPAHYTYLVTVKAKPRKTFHGDKILITHHWGKTYRGKRPAMPGNHERYIIRHAYRMGIPVAEYKRKFCA